MRARGGFAELYNGVCYAVKNGADVINLSIGANLTEEDDEETDEASKMTDAAYAKCEEALKRAESGGCICVAAAGNDGKDLAELNTYPAISEYTVAVSSINISKLRVGTSNYGKYIDFAAPGSNIRSAATSGATNYKSKSGTSMATPHVSAAFAMAALYNTDADAEGLKTIIRDLSVDLGAKGRDDDYGYGLPVFTDEKFPVFDSLNAGDTDNKAGSEGGSKDSLSGSKQSNEGSNASASNASNTSNSKASNASRPAASNTSTSASTAKTTNKTPAVTVTGTAIKKAKRGKRSVTLSWKKISKGISGYQIQYSPDKQFKSGNTVNVKTSKSKYKIKKLKSKQRYYFRMRTYKTLNGKNYYSKWSGIKSAKAK